MSKEPIYYGVDLEKTGKNISRLRMAKGMSVKDIQESLGLAGPGAAYKWERGESAPSLEHLRVLNQIFGEHIEDIVIWVSRGS